MCALVGLALAGAAPAAPPLLRQSRTVVVDGVAETWRLAWSRTPAGVCVAEDVSAATCPCSGFAYGEAGDLWLERLRPGAPLERLRLAPLFEDFLDVDAPGMAVVQRRPRLDTDGHEPDDRSPAIAAAITARPAADVMQLADYDHDGRATEFLLQVGTMPCGKRMMVAVGVSRGDPRLHALGSAKHPGRPLVMPRHAWEALRRSARPAPIRVWECDDHGSEVRSMLTVSAQGGVIRAVDRDYGCPSQGNAGRLLKTTEW